MVIFNWNQAAHCPQVRYTFMHSNHKEATLWHKVRINEIEPCPKYIPLQNVILPDFMISENNSFSLQHFEMHCSSVSLGYQEIYVKT